MSFGVPHFPQHDPFHRSNVERNMQSSPGHGGPRRVLHSLNVWEVAIVAAVLVGIALFVLYVVVL